MRIKKKGQVINTITGVVLGLFVLILIAFAIFMGISELDPTSFFTAGTVEHQQINASVTNLSYGFGQFTAQIPTVFKVLGVVLVLGALAILILIVTRFRGIGGGGGGL